MKLIRDLRSLPSELRGGALSIGNFDGVHRGHRRIIATLQKLAQEVGGPTIVFTFEPHPVRLLRPDQSPPPLTWIDRKAQLLGDLGVEGLIAFPTNQQLLDLEYHEFFQQIVCDALDARAMVEGPNFYFGKDRRGDGKRLRDLCTARGIQLEILEPELAGQDLVSSSRIRQAIQAGDVGLARQWLTQAYRLRGIVVHGDHRGTPLGFPTANLDRIDTLVPGFGVYAGYVASPSSANLVRPHAAAIHVGPSPTFGQQVPRVEVHVLDFTGSLYGETLEVEFWEFLRPIRPFGNLAELTAQIRMDLSQTRQICSTPRPATAEKNSNSREN